MWRALKIPSWGYKASEFSFGSASVVLFFTVEPYVQQLGQKPEHSQASLDVIYMISPLCYYRKFKVKLRGLLV